MENVPPEIREQVLGSLPDVQSLHRKVYEMSGEMLPPSSGHVAIACVCLQNAVELFQDAAWGTYNARCEWHKFKDHKVPDYPDEGRHLFAVKAARHYFDYVANCLFAGMNHLGGAMWHFHEGAEGPLGSDYKSADQIRQLWEKATPGPASLPILQSVLMSPSWVAVAGYRHRWNHREYPLIEGELRNRREVVWKDQAAPEPLHYLMAHIDPGAGKVAYVRSGLGNHEYRMPDLMEAATEGLRLAVGAAEAFLALVQQHFVEAMAGMGVEYTSGG
jgi:hypothetical protein